MEKIVLESCKYGPGKLSLESDGLETFGLEKVVAPDLSSHLY